MMFPPVAKAIFLATLSSIRGTAFTPSTRFVAARSIVSSSSRSSSSVAANYFMSNNRQSSSNNNGVANVIAGACINLNMPLSLRGGGSSSALQSTAATAEVETEAPTEIFRTDYKPLPYKVSNVLMNFDIRDGKTVVESELTVVPNTLDGGKFV